MSITAMAFFSIDENDLALSQFFRWFLKPLSIFHLANAYQSFNHWLQTCTHTHKKQAHWFHYRSLKFIVGPIQADSFVFSLLFSVSTYHQRHDKFNFGTNSRWKLLHNGTNGNEAGRIDFNRNLWYCPKSQSVADQMATLGKIRLDYWPKKMHNGQQYTEKTTKREKSVYRIWMLQIDCKMWE